MPRPRQYDSPAERARQWRLRQAAAQQQAAATTGTLPKQSKQRRPPSRPARIAALDSAAQTLHDEYESWRDATPESLQGSDAWQRLDATVETLAEILNLISQLDPPRGFGKD
jgi:hypothetical protein